jgi:hypothetical protein
MRAEGATATHLTTADLIRRKGDEHKAAYLALLTAEEGHDRPHVH